MLLSSRMQAPLPAELSGLRRRILQSLLNMSRGPPMPPAAGGLSYVKPVANRDPSVTRTGALLCYPGPAPVEGAGR